MSTCSDEIFWRIQKSSCTSRPTFTSGFWPSSRTETPSGRVTMIFISEKTRKPRGGFDDEFPKFRGSVASHVHAGKHVLHVMLDEMVPVGHLPAVGIIDNQPLTRIQGIQPGQPPGSFLAPRLQGQVRLANFRKPVPLWPVIGQRRRVLNRHGWDSPSQFCPFATGFHDSCRNRAGFPDRPDNRYKCRQRFVLRPEDKQKYGLFP